MKIKIIKEGSEETWRPEAPVEPEAEDSDATVRLPPKEKSAMQSLPKTPMGYLNHFGFEDVEPMGSGAVGNVYSADWRGRELAIKVVPKGKIVTDLGGGRELRWSGEKEVRAYEAIMKAREKSKNIEKHFPLVYTIMNDPDHYYIVMERLTDEGPYAAVIDDLFQGSESLVAPGKDLMMYGAWKDLSRRMFMYLKDEKSRDNMVEQLFENFSDEITEIAKTWADNWWKYVDQPSYTQPRSYELIDELIINQQAQDNFLDEFGNLQREFDENPWLAYFILRLIKIAKEHDMQAYYMNYIAMASGFVNMMRTHSPIGTMHEPPYTKKHKGGASDEMSGVYEEARSLKQALKDLESITGMVGVDMHDKNVMMRPIDGAIVIVDVGLFRPRSEVGGSLKEEKRKLSECGPLEEVLYDMDLNMSGIAFKSELNPKIWLKKRLVGGIKEKLLEIASNFLEDSEIDDKIDDIILTGSIVDYNWHQNSDIDLHIVVDYKKFGDEGDLVKKIMDLERMRWNEAHKIMIHGHEVEIYVQDADEDHYAGGIYSLKENKWLAEPLPDAPEVDLNQALKKAEGFSDDIETVQRHFDKKDYEKAHKASSKLKEKIRKMRSAGLEDAGVWSPENIAFKLLRNGGFMGVLRDLHSQSYDGMMGIGKTANLRLNIT